MHMYVIYVRRSLAAVGGHFHGYVNEIWLSSIRAVSVQTEPLFQFCSIQRLTRRHLTDTVFPCALATTV